MKHRFFKINKPPKYLSQFVREQKRTQKRSKKLLGELYDFPIGTMPVGRLDEDSEGLLLLTTNGQESYRICSKGIEKEYFAQVDGVITEQAAKELRKGVEIGFEGTKYQTKPCNVKLFSKIPYNQKGLKVRVMNNDLYSGMISALGGNPSPMAFSEVFQSLKTGVVDGAENNWPSYESTGHFEVAKYYSLSQHLIIPECVCINDKVYNNLSAKNKKAHENV